MLSFGAPRAVGETTPAGAVRLLSYDRDANAGAHACTPGAHRARVDGVSTAVLKKREMAPTIEEGTVVGREGDSVFVAWHGSFVEYEMDVSEVEIWADAPAELRAWQGGIGMFDLATGAITVEPVA